MWPISTDQASWGEASLCTESVNCDEVRFIMRRIAAFYPIFAQLLLYPRTIPMVLEWVTQTRYNHQFFFSLLIFSLFLTNIQKISLIETNPPVKIIQQPNFEDFLSEYVYFSCRIFI